MHNDADYAIGATDLSTIEDATAASRASASSGSQATIVGDPSIHFVVAFIGATFSTFVVFAIDFPITRHTNQAAAVAECPRQERIEVGRFFD